MRFNLAMLSRIALALVAIAVVPGVVNSSAPMPIAAAGLKQILKDPGVAALGSSHPQVTVVEYFDYNCAYCKKLAPDLRSLATDPGVTVLYKDWPIFGGVSVYAARLALAAQWQGRYLQAHDALMSAHRLAQNAQVEAALQHAGLDMETLMKDLSIHSTTIEALLARNHAEALALKLPGTPGILVGRLLVPGVANLEDLQSLVSYVRQEK